MHLPAINTPQFSWGRSRMPGAPQPVPPIYQPEVAADAIVHAAHHAAREYWLGASTDVAILGNMLAPELADQYLAANAISGQRHPEPVDPDRPDNLFTPVPGLHALRGTFGDQAKNSATRISGAPAPALAAAGALGLAALLGFALGRRRP